MKARMLLTLAAAAAIGLSGCKKGGEPGPEPAKKTRINLSLILGDNSEWYAGGKKWKELVEERSAGAFEVRIHPNASLCNGSQRTELTMLQSGQLEASLESTILLTGLGEQKFTAFSLPWMFPSHEVANAICDGPLGQKMLALLPAKGVVGLAYGVNGFRQITNSKRPITSPDDMKGLKIRVPSIPMYVKLFRNLGADASAMNFGELPQALQQGAMDAQENPFSVIYAAKLYTVQKYLTQCNHSYDPLVLCLNAEFFNSLPAAQQELLRTCAKEAMDYERGLVQKADQELPQKLTGLGMELNVLTPEQLAPFKAAQGSLYEEYEGIIGKDLVDAFRQAVAEAEGK